MWDWKNQVVLLLCHIKVLVFWKIIESKLNNTLPGTNEVTLVENWFYCSVSFEDYQIYFFFLALSLSFLLSEFSLCLCAFLVTLFPPHAHTHTRIHASQKNVKKLPSSRAPPFSFRGPGRCKYPQDFSFLLCSYFRLPISSPRQQSHKAVFLCSWLLLPLKTLASQQPVSAMVPGLNTDRHILMSIFSVVLKRMITSN